MQQPISFFDEIEANKRNSILLILVIFALFFAFVWAISYIFHLGIFGMVIGFFALLFYVFIIWTSGDAVILTVSGAKEATRREYPFYYDVAEGLSIASGIPMPKLYVIDDPVPNAFATGRDPEHASMAVTTGLLKTMKREELEGVIAHEISHIANYDIRMMMIAVVFAGAIAILANIVWRSMWYGSFSGGGGKKGGGNAILIIIAIVLIVLAPIFAELVRLAISRQREYLADASAAKLTRYPAGLASALEKISGVKTAVKNATSATAPLYIVNPNPGDFAHFFATHPKIEDRIARLKAM